MAQLPPKIPITTTTTPRNRPNSTTDHRNSPSLSFLPSDVDDNSCCVDNFLNFSTLRRGSHRRSISDSAAVFGPEHLLSIFNDVEFRESTPNSDNNNINGVVEEATVLAEHNHQLHQDHHLKETRNTCKVVDNAAGASQIDDAKRVRRILANRQSAQRSRVKKLQYIMQLERSLTSLQMEISALSPRVAYLDHQRSVLTMGNSAIRQRIVALAQDKIFKDAHQEALKKEVERLRQVYLCTITKV